jgi:hypothetical protein
LEVEIGAVMWGDAKQSPKLESEFDEVQSVEDALGGMSCIPE